MSISRRLFLRAGTLAAVAAGVGLGAGKLALGQKGQRLSTTIMPIDGIPYQARQDTLLYYRRAAFEPCVGTVFEARGASGQTVNLTLLSVAGYDSSATAGLISGRTRETDSFSLTFKANGQLSTSGISNLSHPVLGKFDMFLTGEKRKGELFYQAVVNHLI